PTKKSTIDGIRIQLDSFIFLLFGWFATNFNQVQEKPWEVLRSSRSPYYCPPGSGHGSRPAHCRSAPGSIPWRSPGFRAASRPPYVKIAHSWRHPKPAHHGRPTILLPPSPARSLGTASGVPFFQVPPRSWSRIENRSGPVPVSHLYGRLPSPGSPRLWDLPSIEGRRPENSGCPFCGSPWTSR